MGDELPNLRNTLHKSNKGLPIDPALYGDDLDKELAGVRPNKRGDDECTEENDDDYAVNPYDLDEKQLDAPSSRISKKKKQNRGSSVEIPDMKESQSRKKRRVSKKAIEQEFADQTE